MCGSCLAKEQGRRGDGERRGRERQTRRSCSFRDPGPRLGNHLAFFSWHQLAARSEQTTGAESRSSSPKKGFPWFCRRVEMIDDHSRPSTRTLSSNTATPTALSHAIPSFSSSRAFPSPLLSPLLAMEFTPHQQNLLLELRKISSTLHEMYVSPWPSPSLLPNSKLTRLPVCSNTNLQRAIQSTSSTAAGGREEGKLVKGQTEALERVGEWEERLGGGRSEEEMVE